MYKNKSINHNDLITSYMLFFRMYKYVRRCTNIVHIRTEN